MVHIVEIYLRDGLIYANSGCSLALMIARSIIIHGLLDGTLTLINP